MARRLLFFGDMAATGFGTVTAALGRPLLDRGLDVRFVSLNEQGMDDLPEPFASRTAILGQKDGWLGTSNPEARERIARTFEGGLFTDDWTPEAALFLGDFTSLAVSIWADLLPEGFPAWHYVPIEGVGLPPFWNRIWQRITPIAMSEFGATEIEKVTGSRPLVAYHGVDTSVFHPPTPKHPLTTRGQTLRVVRSREDAKRLLGLDPKRLLLFRADANMPRKMYGALLRSIAPVLAEHPNVDFLYHCKSVGPGGDLDDERSKYGPFLGWEDCGQELCIRDRRHPRFGGIAARMVSTGLWDHGRRASAEALAVMYAAGDIYVSNSAEGFGLTIAESIACGTPAVGIGYSSVPEVIGPAGVLVPPGTLIDNIYSHFWAWVDEPKFAVAVDELIRDPARRMVLGAKGPFHVEQFRWDTAAGQIAGLVEAREEMAA